MTIIWMAIVVANEGKEPFEVLWKPPSKWEVQHTAGVTYVLDSAQSPEVLRTQIRDAAKRTATLLEQQGDHAGAKEQIEWADGPSVGELIKIVTDKKADQADRLRGALFWLLGPPAVLLMLGLMTGWVAKGFRR